MTLITDLQIPMYVIHENVMDKTDHGRARQLS